MVVEVKILISQIVEFQTQKEAHVQRNRSENGGRERVHVFGVGKVVRMKGRRGGMAYGASRPFQVLSHNIDSPNR